MKILISFAKIQGMYSAFNIYAAKGSRALFHLHNQASIIHSVYCTEDSETLNLFFRIDFHFENIVPLQIQCFIFVRQ